MTDRPHERAGPRSQPGRRWLIAALVVALFVAAGAAHARFNGGTTLGSNAFATDTLAPPTALTLTGTMPVALSWTPTASTYATGTNVYRSTTPGGSQALVTQLTPRTTATHTEDPGLGAYYYQVRSYFQNWLSVASNQVVRDDPTFVFKSTTGYTLSGNCYAASQRERDMEQGFVPTDPAETMQRTGGTGLLTFCSDTFTAGEALAAGNATVNLYVANTAGSTCALTVYIGRNDTVTLGTASITIPSNSALALRTLSIPITGFTAAAGDRINVLISWQSVKACDSTVLHYDGAATASSITLPTISGV